MEEIKALQRSRRAAGINQLIKEIFLATVKFVSLIAMVFSVLYSIIFYLQSFPSSVFIAVICNDDTCETARNAYNSWGKAVRRNIRSLGIFLVSTNPNSKADIIVDNSMFTKNVVNKSRQVFYSDLAAMNYYRKLKYDWFVRVYDTAYINARPFGKKIREFRSMGLTNGDAFIAANFDRKTHNAYAGSGWILNRNAVDLWYTNKGGLTEFYEEEPGDVEEQSHFLLKWIDIDRCFRHQSAFIPFPVSEFDFNNLKSRNYKAFKDCEPEDGYLPTQIPVNEVIIWDGKGLNDVQKYGADITYATPEDIYFYKVNNTVGVCRYVDDLKQ